MVETYMDLIQQGQLSRIKPAYGYYRQSNGWITVDVTTELEELAYRREGWEPLSQYGRFDMTAEYAANHPFELLFMKGGAKELPLEQIIESGFHLRPPIIPVCGMALTQYHKWHTPGCWVNAQPVHFPQLDGLDPALLQGYQCRLCDRPLFPTEKAREQHESVMHKDEKSDIRTGQTLAEAMVAGLRGGQVPEEEWTPDPSKPYACGFCAEAFASLPQLGRHVKTEHKPVEVGVSGEQEE